MLNPCQEVCLIEAIIGCEEVSVVITVNALNLSLIGLRGSSENR